MITALTPYTAQWKEFYEIHLLFGIDEHSASNPMQYNVILDISLRISGRRVWQLKKLRTRGLLRAPFCFTVRVRVRVFLYTSKSLSYMGSPQNPQPFQFLSSRYVALLRTATNHLWPSFIIHKTINFRPRLKRTSTLGERIVLETVTASHAFYSKNFLNHCESLTFLRRKNSDCRKLKGHQTKRTAN